MKTHQEKILDMVMDDAMTKRFAIENAIVDWGSVAAGSFAAIVFGKKALETSEHRKENLALATLGMSVACTKFASLMQVQTVRRKTEELMDATIQANASLEVQM